MNGKIKLKLNQKYSFFNNRYEVFVDDDYIGMLITKIQKLISLQILVIIKFLSKRKILKKNIILF